MIALAWLASAIIVAALLYLADRIARWEHKLIVAWLDSDRSTPPPNSAFFPPEIARQWWIDYEKRQ